MERILIALCAAFIMMHFQPKSTNHKLIFIILVMVFSYLITRNIQHSVVIGLNAYLAHAIATEHLPRLLKRENFLSKENFKEKVSNDDDSDVDDESETSDNDSIISESSDSESESESETDSDSDSDYD